MKINRIRLWLDDCRPMPENFDRSVQTAAEAIGLIEAGEVGFISFDHDLGDELLVGNGYQVASRIEELVFHGQLQPIGWSVHSANPVGKSRIEAAMRSAERWWSTRA